MRILVTIQYFNAIKNQAGQFHKIMQSKSFWKSTKSEVTFSQKKCATLPYVRCHGFHGQSVATKCKKVLKSAENHGYLFLYHHLLRHYILFIWFLCGYGANHNPWWGGQKEVKRKVVSVCQLVRNYVSTISFSFSLKIVKL